MADFCVDGVVSGDSRRGSSALEGSHRWSPDPITASLVVGDSDPDATPTASPDRLIGPPTPIDRLSAALHANAKGLLCTEAAVDLLIQQQTWLHRRDFVNNHVETDTTTNTASVNWGRSHHRPQHRPPPLLKRRRPVTPYRQSLADRIPIDLDAAITSLDATNTTLVANAIYHAAGHRP